MIRLREITLPFDHSEDALVGTILERLDVEERQLLNFTIVQKRGLPWAPMLRPSTVIASGRS